MKPVAEEDTEEDHLPPELAALANLDDEQPQNDDPMFSLDVVDPGDTVEDPSPAAPTPKSPGQKRWSKVKLGVKVTSKLLHKVNVENKIGQPPTGFLADLCACIQEGYHQALSQKITHIESKGRPKGDIPGFEMTLLHDDLFSRVRASCQVNATEFRAALEPPQDSGATNLFAIGTAEASGKSSAFFLLSSDQRYVIKSMTQVDYLSLQNELVDYTEHLEAHPASLLPRFLGLFDLTLSGGQSYSLVVMTNFFAGMRPIHSRYDLKGSTIGRTASEKEKAKGDKAILKDLDWMGQGRRIKLPSQHAKDEFEKVLSIDSEWLAAHELIDYSLLVGIHSRARVKAETELDYKERAEYMHVCTVDDGEDVLYVGIVDILQPYTMRKSCETAFCGKLCCDRNISCCHPDKYAQRFKDFLVSLCTVSLASGEDEEDTGIDAVVLNAGAVKHRKQSRSCCGTSAD